MAETHTLTVETESPLNQQCLQKPQDRDRAAHWVHLLIPVPVRKKFPPVGIQAFSRGCSILEPTDQGEEYPPSPMWGHQRHPVVAPYVRLVPVWKRDTVLRMSTTVWEEGETFIRPESKATPEEKHMGLVYLPLKGKIKKLPVVRCHWHTKIAILQTDACEPIPLWQGLKNVWRSIWANKKNLQETFQSSEVSDWVKTAPLLWNQKVNSVETTELDWTVQKHDGAHL